MKKTMKLAKICRLLLTAGVGLGTGTGCGELRSIDCEDRPGCETGEGSSTTSTGTGTDGSSEGSGDGDSADSAGDDSTTETGGVTDEGRSLCGNGEIDEGEECDDGNSRGGDTCLADCQAPGAVIDENVFDFDTENTETDDEAREVVHVTETSVHILSEPKWHVFEVDTESMEISAEPTELESGHLTTKNLASTPSETSMLAGYQGSEGLVQFFESDAALGEALIYGPEGDNVDDVRFRIAIPDRLGNVIVAGSYGDGAIISRIAMPENDFVKWELAATNEGEFGPITLGSDYIIRAWEESGSLWLIDQTNGEVIGTKPILDMQGISDLGVALNMTSDNDLYISISHNAERRIVKMNEHGTLLWSKPWTDDLEGFAGAATLPSGGIIVAGAMEERGALLWVSGDGDPWFVANGLEPPSDRGVDYSRLDDVAVSPTGAHAIAVGSVKPVGSSNSDLWIRKFEI